MRRLRSVILQRIGIVAAVSFLLSGGFTYSYYRAILVPQMLSEDRARLAQTMRQLEYLSDDVATFSFFLIISDQLQTFFKTYDSLDTYGQFALVRKTFDYLDDNQGLRKEVQSFALVLPDGRAFWSEARNDSYFTDRLQEAWYQNYKRSGQEHAFTEPHVLPVSSNFARKSLIISYVVKVKNIRQPDMQLGELIVNLDYQSFADLLDYGSGGFGGFWWLNGAGSVLYGKEQTGGGRPAAKESQIREAAKAQRDDWRVPGGHLLTESSEDHHWQLVSYISNRQLMHRAKFVLYLLGVFSVTSTAMILLLMMPAILRMTRPIMRLYQAMNAVSNGNLQASVDIRTGDELEKLGQGFNRMTFQLRAHLEETIRYEQNKRELELELLLSQLNPHFVYNTLNAVIYMAQRQGNRDIARLTGALIRILQDAGKIGDSRSLIPLRDELRLLRDYVDIQSYRYAGMFEVISDVDEEALDALVPRWLIQPFIENAIFHGICPKEAFGIIRLTAVLRDRKLIIRIEDDGVGIAPEQLAVIWERTEARKTSGLRHIGLANTKNRLDHLFNRLASIRIDSELGRGTVVTVEVPQMAVRPGLPDTGKQA